MSTSGKGEAGLAMLLERRKRRRREEERRRDLPFCFFKERVGAGGSYAASCILDKVATPYDASSGQSQLPHSWSLLEVTRILDLTFSDDAGLHVGWKITAIGCTFPLCAKRGNPSLWWRALSVRNGRRPSCSERSPLGGSVMGGDESEGGKVE